MVALWFKPAAPRFPPPPPTDTRPRAGHQSGGQPGLPLRHTHSFSWIQFLVRALHQHGVPTSHLFLGPVFGFHVDLWGSKLLGGKLTPGCCRPVTASPIGWGDNSHRQANLVRILRAKL